MLCVPICCAYSVILLSLLFLSIHQIPEETQHERCLHNYTSKTYGPIDRYQRAGNIKIKGKDLFLESLLKLIESNKGKDSISILESLKEQSKDWKSIDNKIDSIKENKFDIIKESEFLKYKEGVSKFLEKYSSDDELCLLAVKENVSVMKNKEIITNKYLACKTLKEENKFSSVIDGVIDIYESKISKL